MVNLLFLEDSHFTSRILHHQNIENGANKVSSIKLVTSDLLCQGGDSQLGHSMSQIFSK